MKHRTQHRTESEEARRNRLHAETRRENRELRRTVARLTKELQKLKESQDTDAEPSAPEAPKKPAHQCPDCGSFSLKEVPLPTGTVVTTCKACGWQGWRKHGRDRPAA